MLTKDKNFHRSRRFIVFWVSALVFICVFGLIEKSLLLKKIFRRPLSINGIVWQLSRDTTSIRGDWQKLGANHLLIQWSMVNNINFLTGPEGIRPDWLAISQQPWAQYVILGLAGNFDEKIARKNSLALAKESLQLISQSGPLNVSGYYFPVESDPTWLEVQDDMPKALALLPRPLWISVYDNSNIGSEPFAKWLSGWLPHDVGIFFQDGVGVEARSAPVARQYADALSNTFGHNRVKVIVEAFRPSSNGKFRAALAAEILPQITAMQGYDIYPFAAQYLDSKKVSILERLMRRS